MSFGTRILGALIVACSLGVQGAGLSKKFWFGGPEIFPIDHQVHSLNVADLDGDGRKDILVINIRRSRLNILYNRTGLKPLEVKKRDSRGVNHLPPDSRFELDSMSTELRVVGVTHARESDPSSTSTWGTGPQVIVAENLDLATLDSHRTVTPFGNGI